VIGRIAILFVLGAAFVTLLAAAAATAPTADREQSTFRRCIASIAHPALPAPLLTRNAIARRRALALLAAEDTCGRVSGIDGSGKALPLEVVHAWLHGGSGAGDARSFLARCNDERRDARGAARQIIAGMDCYRHSGGLTGTQFELATGYNTAFRVVGHELVPSNTTILSKRRYPRTTAHVRDGTWWYQSCS
jgi:hypothetical protein